MSQEQELNPIYDHAASGWKKLLKNTAMALIDLPNIVTFTFSNFKQNFQPKSDKESKLRLTLGLDINITDMISNVINIAVS